MAWVYEIETDLGRCGVACARKHTGYPPSIFRLFAYRWQNDYQRHVLSLGVASLLVLMSSVSNASTVTQSYTFSFSDFQIIGAPYVPLAGSFTITYDPDVFGITGSLGAFSSNLPASYGTFVWLNQNGLGLVIGDYCNTVNCVAAANEAFISIPQKFGHLHCKQHGLPLGNGTNYSRPPRTLDMADDHLALRWRGLHGLPSSQSERFPSRVV